MSLKAKVKQTILDCLIHKCDREYDRTYQYAKKSLSYGNLIPLLEAGRKKEASELDLEVFPYTWEEQIDVNLLRILCEKTDYVVLCEKACSLHPDALSLIGIFLKQNPHVQVLYGDEDVMDEAGRRSTPWFKPQWSPTLFLQQHYVGALTVVKSDLLCAALDASEYADTRHLLCAVMGKVGGYKRRDCKLRIAHIDHVLVHHPNEQSYEKYVCAEKLQEATETENIIGKISIIIPSKDHADILEQNLCSLEQTTSGLDVEVVVVDNGSDEECQSRIRKLIHDLTIDVKYLYQKMEFNFSAMCNLGAKESTGAYLLFLNDDIEATEEGWLQRMLAVAGKEYAGCVGMKLLYPETDKIQHAGVVNLEDGPVHKLQMQSDAENHYFGWNMVDHECMAVTGACMLLRRELFESVGGFDEDLPVTFNDMDLCYKLYANGYYNICLNEVFLYHHESLSRGADVSSEKKQRLMAEREKLYKRHGVIAKDDPYYHPLLNRQTSDMRILPALEERMKVQRTDAVIKPWTEKGRDVRRHEGVRFSANGNAFKGYLLMLGDDNACYENALIFTNKKTKEAYWCKLNKTLREDIQQAMPDQKNIALCGFEVRLIDLPEGDYEVKALAHNKISGVFYWNETPYAISITEE